MYLKLISGIKFDVCKFLGVGTDYCGVSNLGGNLFDLDTRVSFFFNIVLLMLGIVSVAVGIMGGYNIITSGGDVEKKKKGINTIKYLVVGLVVSLLSYFIVNLVMILLTGKGIVQSIYILIIS